MIYRRFRVLWLDQAIMAYPEALLEALLTQCKIYIRAHLCDSNISGLHLAPEPKYNCNLCTLYTITPLNLLLHSATWPECANISEFMIQLKVDIAERLAFGGPKLPSLCCP
ncbi:hypothetical protein GDO78_008976 [Eleutherodactylus coqui]|uniref:Uncharacterized protein n=1 Tax=Eleutherodactylus coqui TaxID=57060 RepID=A0A8J6FEK7_ELECQ|nr:hypothetical protein GDO78_008976 [Eleutherodactylus coqui]